MSLLLFFMNKWDEYAIILKKGERLNGTILTENGGEKDESINKY